ncbi:MAG: hypothetical protein ACXWEZ_13620 [Actinomycetota bacterium]
MTDHDDPRQGEGVRWQLRATIRCLEEDIEGTTAADAERPVEDLEPELVRKFVSMRSQDPKGLEKVQPLENASEVYTLHAGRWRGATWHDRENEAVWLLAGRFHRSGAADDAYPHFKGLDAESRLLPTAGDYELLFAIQTRSFVDDVMEKSPTIVEEARRRSPAEVEAVLGTVPVSVAVVIEDEIEFVYLAVMMSKWTEDGPEPPANWTAILWAAFFPWVTDPIAEIDTETEMAGRPAKEGELIYVSMSEG